MLSKKRIQNSKKNQKPTNLKEIDANKHTKTAQGAEQGIFEGEAEPGGY